MDNSYLKNYNGDAAPVTEFFGCSVFNETVMRERLPKEVLESLKHTINDDIPLNPQIAEIIAEAMKDWAVENGATHYTHWFQPLGEVTAEKHDAFITPTADGKVIMKFSGKNLIKGESDASSFPSGGLRVTFEARGYTAWDCTSPAFIKDRTLYIPTVFCSYTGEALDKKTPLLRSMEALNKQALRVLRRFGIDAKKVTPMVGPEQEYFLIDRELYEKRPDLLVCGRTLFGSKPPKGQELDDHYFGRLRLRISAFMHDLDTELWRLGVTAKTKHNEAAPAQHELAVIFDSANVACDHNQIVMETMRIVAKKHGLACLLHEKPFNGVNGSGKHMNWSLSTETGKNLFDPSLNPEKNLLFLLFVAAMLKGVDEYQDLLRFSCASAGNDHRLGANEAPPGIISVFLGDELTEIFSNIQRGSIAHSHPQEKVLIGVSSLPSLNKDSTDRNRTSPCAFTGNKFEFRMCGSTSAVSKPCYIVNTIMAEALSFVADELDSIQNINEENVHAIIRKIINDHSRIIFNGDNYSDEWKREAENRGLLNLPTTLDALPCLLEEKNLSLFEKHGVLSRAETVSRYDIDNEVYSKVINIEALIMQEMTEKQIIPTVMSYCGDLARDGLNIESFGGDATAQKDDLKQITALLKKTRSALKTLTKENQKALSCTDVIVQANAYGKNVIPIMEKLRDSCDALEHIMPYSRWPFPNYFDLMYRI